MKNNMKKIMIIDGGPRKTMNTAQMLDALIEGAKSANEEVEIKHVRLYDIDYKGCRSCLACKVKGKATNVCVFKDGLKDVLEDIATADALVLASPIFNCDITGEMHSFLERLVFPWLSYVDYSVKAPKRMPVVFVYTMNATPEQSKMIFENIRINEWLVTNGLGEAEHLVAYNTYQVKNYDRFEFAPGQAEYKQAYKDMHWADDLQNAYDLGKRLVEKAKKIEV